MRRESLRAGIRAGIPYAVAAGLLAVSFGVLAEPVIGAGATFAMSAFVFAGSAQFGSVAVLAGGGGLAAAASPTQGGQAKPKKPPPTGGSSAGCSIPATYQNFKFAGVDCASALAVADAWDASPDKCNTIDNPDSPLGYNRTCSIEGYTCDAKRDVRSDGRFVTCTQGGASIRFTWFPS